MQGRVWAPHTILSYRQVQPSDGLTFGTGDEFLRHCVAPSFRAEISWHTVERMTCRRRLEPWTATCTLLILVSSTIVVAHILTLDLADFAVRCMTNYNAVSMIRVMLEDLLIIYSARCAFTVLQPATSVPPNLGKVSSFDTLITQVPAVKTTMMTYSHIPIGTWSFVLRGTL